MSLAVGSLPLTTDFQFHSTSYKGVGMESAKSWDGSGGQLYDFLRRGC